MGVKLSAIEARVLRERRGKTLYGRCRGSQTVGVKTPWESNGGSQTVGVKTPCESSVGVVCASTIICFCRLFNRVIFVVKILGVSRREWWCTVDTNEEERYIEEIQSRTYNVKIETDERQAEDFGRQKEGH